MMNKMSDARGNAFDLRAFIVLIYIFLPNAIYLAGWINLALGLPIIGLISYVLWALWRCVRKSGQIGLSRRTLILLIVAAGWTYFGGAGHFLYANFDWITRDAVLRDLSVMEWPVYYGIDSGFKLVLRCPIGYYLPAALMGKLLGVQYSDLFLWIWTVIGVALFLGMLPLSGRSALRFILGLLVIILFSGMDVAPFLLHQREWPGLGSHLEWWAENFQYSSNSTLLFWVPNHALPAWLSTVVYLRYRQDTIFIRIAPLLLACLPLWSPFAFIGLMPFYLISFVHWIKNQQIRSVGFAECAPAIALMCMVIPYLVMDISGIRGGTIMDGGLWDIALMRYASFVVIEFGLLAFILSRIVGMPSQFAAAVVVLLVLPFVSYGPANDIVMWASIPSLLVVCYLVLDILERRSFSDDPVRYFMLTVVILLGAVTPLHEFYRSVSQSVWSFDAGRGMMALVKDEDGYPAHYVAHLDSPFVTLLFSK